MVTCDSSLVTTAISGALNSPRSSTSQPARLSMAWPAAARAVKLAMVAPVVKPAVMSTESPRRFRTQRRETDMPVAGMNRKAYRTKKLGSWDRSLAMDVEVTAIGKSLGIEFDYDKVLMTPNTMSGHRLLWG